MEYGYAGSGMSISGAPLGSEANAPSTFPTSAPKPAPEWDFSNPADSSNPQDASGGTSGFPGSAGDDAEGEVVEIIQRCVKP